MAEMTEDERKPEAAGDERRPEETEDERKPEATEDEREREATGEQREREAAEDEREPEAAEDDGEGEATEDEQRREPKDLPEPEEKSADDLLGRQVIDPHGYTIGKIDALFIHGQDERARWARVKTGLVRTSSAFVPLHDAQEDGSKIRVVYEKEHVDAAPEIEPEGNELSDDDADVLHNHYGLERVKGLTKETAEQGDIELPRETRDANPPTMKERPWAVEKYPLPDMERPDEADSSRSDEEDTSRAEEEDSSRSEEEDSSRSDEEDTSRAESSRQESSDEESSGERSSGEGSEDRAGG